MIYCLATLFNNGVDNDGDVTINCSNGQNFMAHSFVLSHCSDLFKTVSDSVTPGEKIVWNLSSRSIDNVRNAVSNMYVLGKINNVDDIKAKAGDNNMHTFFNLLEYMQPTIFFKRAIKDIVLKYSSLIENIIRYGTVQKSCKSNPNDVNRRLLEILIVLKNNNEYICAIRNNITKKFTDEIKILSSIRDLCMANNDTNPFIDYGMDKAVVNNNTEECSSESSEVLSVAVGGYKSFIKQQAKQCSDSSDEDTSTEVSYSEGSSEIPKRKRAGNANNDYKSFVMREMPIIKRQNPKLKNFEYMQMISKKWHEFKQNIESSEDDIIEDDSDSEDREKTQAEPYSYNMFVKQQMPIIRREHPELKATECMQLVGKKWRDSDQNPKNRNR